MKRSLRVAPNDVCSNKDGIVWKALTKKTASYGSTYAFLCGAVDFLVIGVVLAALESELTKESSVSWWACVLVCTVCCLNLAYHAWCCGSGWLLPPLPLANTEQQQLLALHDSECTIASPPKIAETPARSSPLFSDVLQQVLRTPPRTELSATMLDSSALSWASYGGSPGGSPLLSQSWHGYSPAFAATPTQPRSWLGSPEVSVLGATACSNTSWLTSPDVAAAPLGATACTNTSWLSNPPSPHLSAAAIHSSMHGCSSPSNPSLLSGTSSYCGAAMSPSVGGGTSSPALRAASRITSRKELDAYIAQYQHHLAQMSSVIERSSGGQGGGGDELWRGAGPAHQQLGEVTSPLARNTYQKATPDPVLVSGDKASDKTKDATSAVASAASKVWVARGVSPKQLFQYEENLRIFLCGSVVQPLVKLIDCANAVLADIAPDMQIGVVGVEKLRKACVSSSQLSGVRHISALVPLLERAPAHQHYLVSRLRELGSGGALSSYCWNRGGHGWTERCPTDAVLVVQLLAFFLDSQLPVDPRESEGRVFSSRHLLNPEDKPPQPLTYPVLHITKLSPPHIKVLLPEEGECEVGEGHKNALHCLLLFLHHLVHAQHGCIAGVNLALTGINLAWVVADH